MCHTLANQRVREDRMLHFYTPASLSCQIVEIMSVLVAADTDVCFFHGKHKVFMLYCMNPASIIKSLCHYTPWTSGFLLFSSDEWIPDLK